MDAKDTIGENGADGPDMPRLRGGLPLGRAKVGRPKDPAFRQKKKAQATLGARLGHL